MKKVTQAIDKKAMKKFLPLASVMVAFMMPMLMMAPVFALECGDVPTGILSCGKDEGIKHILELVVEIMTVGIGILGVIGITIVGIQYLTAGGNEEKTRKAKRRMFEIILGLVAYVVIFAALTWLIPGFKPFEGI